MKEYLLILVSAVFVNNIVMVKILGLCPFMGVSKKLETAIGMASGYAKATGKLPAVMIHTTVGSLHGTMAMRGALHEQVPMVIFAGESVGFGEDEGPDVSPGREGDEDQHRQDRCDADHRPSAHRPSLPDHPRRPEVAEQRHPQEDPEDHQIRAVHAGSVPASSPEGRPARGRRRRRPAPRPRSHTPAGGDPRSCVPPRR